MIAMHVTGFLKVLFNSTKSGLYYIYSDMVIFQMLYFFQRRRISVVVVGPLLLHNVFYHNQKEIRWVKTLFFHALH